MNQAQSALLISMPLISNIFPLRTWKHFPPHKTKLKESTGSTEMFFSMKISVTHTFSLRPIVLDEAVEDCSLNVGFPLNNQLTKGMF